MEPQEKKPISNFSFLNAVSEIFLEALSFSISRKWLKRVSNTAFETRPPVETPINASFKHKGQLRHGLMLLWFTDLMNVTEEVTIHRPTFRHSCLVLSSGVKALDRSVETLGL